MRTIKSKSLGNGGGHAGNLPRTRRDHAGPARQELARFDREDGIRRRIKAFAGVLLGQIP